MSAVNATTKTTAKGSTNIKFVKDRYQEVAFVDTLSTTVDPAPLQSIGLPGGRLVRYGEGDEHENDHPVFALDVLIFIQGVEVSEFCQGQIQIDKNTIEGQNRATFTLSNVSDRFIWSEANLRDVLGTTNPVELRRIQELQGRVNAGGAELTEDNLAASLELDKLLKSRFTDHSEEVKRQVFEYKSNSERNPRIRNAKNTPLFARFDLQPNRCCFGRMDPIRIFSLYPFRVPGRNGLSEQKELWIPEFTGYIWNCSIEDDDINGASTVTVEAVDFSQAVLRRMRISADVNSGITNPLDLVGFAPLSTTNLAGNLVSGAGNAVNETRQRATELAQSLSDRFFDPKSTQFYDDVAGSIQNQQFFPELPMEDAIVELLVFKEQALQAGLGNRGVRNVSLGGSFFYDSASQDRTTARTYLEDWHRFCLFGPKRRPWTREEVNAVGKETTTDGDYNPSNVRLWFMLPKEGTGPKSVTDLATVSANMTHEINWTTRAEVLHKLVDSIDYRMFISPVGDLICEFAMADFRPEDFGEFKDSFRVNRGLINSSFGDEEGDPLAGLVVMTGFAQGVPSAKSDVAEAFYQKSFVFSPYIAARYGMTTDSTQLPFLRAADKAIAQQRAIIEFQKRNAQCNVLNCSFSYRPFLLPNRPIHHLRRTRMGTIVSLNTAFTFGSDTGATTGVALENVRTWTGHYRSPADLESPNELQKAELESGGITTPGQALGIDPVTSPDPIELQVFTSIMAGESTPMSARVGWGTDESGSILAPASGVYLIDLQKRQKPEQTSVVTPHEEEKVDEAATETPVPVTPEVPNEHVFKNNPLSVMNATSPFGTRTLGGKTKEHNGLDLNAAVGTDLFAVDDGVIDFSGTDKSRKSNGNRVTLRTNSGYTVTMIHLEDATVVSSGQEVTAGQRIGTTGNTGASRGPHLHIQIRNPEGVVIDPAPLFPGPVSGRKGGG